MICSPFLIFGIGFNSYYCLSDVGLCSCIYLIQDSRYDFNDLNQSKKLIFQDYSDATLAVLRKNIPFDVENFMNLHVEIDDKVVTSEDGEIYHSLVYYVWIQYWRETRYRDSLNRLIKWIVAFICLVSFALLLLRIFSVI